MMTTSNRFRSRIISTIAALILGLALLDMIVGRADLTALYDGARFSYLSHVNQGMRAWLAVIGVVAVALWILLRRSVPIISDLRFGAVLLLVSACTLFSLVAPLGSLTQVAGHLESERSTQATYHLFYQYQGIAAQTCDAVLVRCDRTGLICRHVDHWPLGARCLANATPTRLTMTPDGLSVRLFEESFCCFE